MPSFSALLLVLFAQVSPVDPKAEPGQKSGSADTGQGVEAGQEVDTQQAVESAPPANKPNPEPPPRELADPPPSASALAPQASEAPVEPEEVRALQVSVAPAPAPAKPALTLTPDLSFFSRYERREGYRALGVSTGRTLEGDVVAYRLRFGFTTSEVVAGEGQSVSARFVAQSSGFWGNEPESPLGLGLYEGFLRYTTEDAVVQVGRIEMKYGDGQVIASPSWTEDGRAFDAVRSRFLLPSDAWVDLFVTQVAEGRGGIDTSAGAGDHYFSGVYAGLGSLFAENLALDAYLLSRVLPRTTSLTDPSDPMSEEVHRSTAAQFTFGSRIKGNLELLDYRAEAGLQIGSAVSNNQTRKATAYQGNGEVGVQVAPARGRAALEGFYATGDDQNTRRLEGWDPLFASTHSWLGSTDIIGRRTNVYGAALHLSTEAVPRFTFAADQYLFFRPRGPAGAEPYAGAELDLLAEYSITEAFALRGSYGIFFPGTTQYPSDDPAHFFETELSLSLP